MAERLEFLVQGSADEPYRVVIEKHRDNLNAFCNCAAAGNGQNCKHRMRILSGNPDGVISANVGQVKLVVDWLVGTDVEVALKELVAAEDGHLKAKRMLEACKKRFVETLRK